MPVRRVFETVGTDRPSSYAMTLRGSARARAARTCRSRDARGLVDLGIVPAHDEEALAVGVEVLEQGPATRDERLPGLDGRSSVSSARSGPRARAIASTALASAARDGVPTASLIVKTRARAERLDHHRGPALARELDDGVGQARRPPALAEARSRRSRPPARNRP